MAFIRNNNGRRHNNNYNRNRHHNSGQQGGNQPRRFTNRANQVFDSAGPDIRVRGTAQQLVEKYSQLARDCSSRDDRVLMISYLQHAEHYQRLVNEIAEETAATEREREAYRAQQASQPDVNPIEIVEGAMSEAQPAPGNEAYAQQPRRDDRRYDRRDDRREREPRRAERSDDGAEDSGDLPSFLQPPTEQPRRSESAPRGRGSSRRQAPSDQAPSADTSGEDL